MIDILYNTERTYGELDIFECGTQDCNGGYTFGPAVRDIYILEYVIKGKGYFKVEDTLIELNAGQGFLICPDLLTHFSADDKDPWSYLWIGFRGNKAAQYLEEAGFTNKNQVFNFNNIELVEKYFSSMFEGGNLNKGKTIYWQAHLLLLLSMHKEALSTENLNNKKIDMKEIYMKKAIEYMKLKYVHKITIQDVAHNTGIDSKYLCKIFNKYLNCSPQSFLLNIRIERACELLKYKSLSIAEIARSVGYEDQFLFSKMFKKVKNIAPTEYRKL